MRIQLGKSTGTRSGGERTQTVKSSAVRHFHKQILLKTKEQQGREAWAALHSYDGCDPLWVKKTFERMIPNAGGCTCKSDYKKILEQHPFNFSSPDAFFVSGVRLHNAVNEKLGKSVMSLDEARILWNRPAPENSNDASKQDESQGTSS